MNKLSIKSQTQDITKIRGQNTRLIVNKFVVVTVCIDVLLQPVFTAVTAERSSSVSQPL